MVVLFQTCLSEMMRNQQRHIQILTPLPNMPSLSRHLKHTNTAHLFYSFHFLSLLFLHCCFFLRFFTRHLHLCLSPCSGWDVFRNPTGFYVSSPEQFVLHFLFFSVLNPPQCVLAFSVKSTKKQQQKQSRKLNMRFWHQSWSLETSETEACS